MEALWLVILLGFARASDVTDEEYSHFPRLFHLDDYDSCLARREGLFCLGSLKLTPTTQPHHVYDLMTEYSSEPLNFDRTVLHRGYCVSSRCPSLDNGNASFRFEGCVDQWAQKRNLSVTLTKLSYCRSHAQELAEKSRPEPLGTRHKVFMWTIGILLLLNAVGTAYDLFVGDKVKKNQKLMCWSVVSNWRRLISTYQDDPRLAALSPVQGGRVLLTIIILSCHTVIIHIMMYLQNPRLIEQLAHHPLVMLFLNGSSAVQLFVMLSGFLLSYNMLLISKKQKLSVTMFPYIIVKRVAKTWPLHMLVVGFAATWWPRTGAGPMWALARAESQVCKDKFWAHALYVNNLVKPDDFCLVQTWSLAVDFQLYVVGAALCLFLMGHRQRAMPILAVLTLSACALNGALAYLFDWKSTLYYISLETVHTLFSGIPSFTQLYTSPWGSLPACLIGLFAGYLQFEIQEAGIKVTDYKLGRVNPNVPLALIFGWILSGSWLRQFSQPWFMALHVALDRPIMALIGVLFAGMVNGVDSFWSRLFSFRFCHVMGRVSLAVLMVHWSLMMTIAATRPQLIYSSPLSATVDFLASTVLSYLVAVPLTVLVEIPVNKFISSFFYLNKPIE